MTTKESAHGSAWIVAVSMGYGHQRTAYPLRELSPEHRVLNANDYRSMPAEDRRLWEKSRGFYEAISNFERLPLVGKAIFRIFDHFQKIVSFYPRENLRPPNLALRQNFFLIRRGWGKHLVETLSKHPLPLISTFFTPAYMAEFWNYPQPIYCVVCDSDISRTWASIDAAASQIRYFAPTEHAVERLLRYGVRRDRIFLTGYPLPKENLGSPRFEVARHDLGERLVNLDPQGTYRVSFAPLVKQYVGQIPKEPSHPLTVLFSIGGAGAQKEIAAAACRSLREKITSGALRFIVSTGTRPEVKAYIEAALKRLGLERSVRIIGARETTDYFREFNLALRTTDILWTKPSELSFYAALGLPLIIAPPIGSQEEANGRWLMETGAGLPQDDPRYAHEWLFDRLESQWFAEAALHGFIKIEKGGAFAIEKIIKDAL